MSEMRQFPREFVKCFYEPAHEGSRVQLHVMYAHYEQACKKYDVPVASRAVFWKAVRLVYPGLKAKYGRIGERKANGYYRTARFYHGITLRGKPLEMIEISAGNWLCRDSIAAEELPELTKEFVIDKLMEMLQEIERNYNQTRNDDTGTRTSLLTAKEKILDKLAKITGAYKEVQEDLLMNHVINLTQYENGRLHQYADSILDQMAQETSSCRATSRQNKTN